VADLTTFDAFLKLNYGDEQRVQTLVYTDNAFLAWIKKIGNTGGKKLIAPVLFGAGQAISSSFAATQLIAASSGGSTQSTDWVIDWGDYYADLEIDNKLMELSNGENTAYLEARRVEIDNLHRQFGQNLNAYLLRGRARNLGSFTINAGVCTMTNADDIVHVLPGMWLHASANTGGSTAHTLLGSGSIGYVIGVNHNEGTFTVSDSDGGAAAVPTGWTGTMYVFRYGDFGGTSSPNRIVDGFDDWCPSSDPDGTVFNGVTRTRHITALSGVRLSSAEVLGQSTEYRIKRLAARMSNRGFGKPEVCFLNPETWQDVADGLEARGIREFGKDAVFGFRSFQVATGGGTIEVFSDRAVPSKAIYMLSKDAFVLKYPQEKMISPVNGDGLTMLRKNNANKYEYRLALYPAVEACPGKLGRTLAA